MLTDIPSHWLGKPEDIAALIAFLFPTTANGSTVRSSLFTRLDQTRLNDWAYTAGLACARREHAPSLNRSFNHFGETTYLQPKALQDLGQRVGRRSGAGENKRRQA